MMKVPIFSEDWGKNGSWFPLYVKTLTEGQYAGEFPTVEEAKKEAKRALSFIGNGEVDFWLVKMPQPGDPMPDFPELSDMDYPLRDTWVINDRSALFMHVKWPLACDLQGGANSQDGGPATVEQQTPQLQATGKQAPASQRRWTSRPRQQATVDQHARGQQRTA